MSLTIPAVVNRGASGAGEAARALDEIGGFDVHQVAAADIGDAVREAARAKPSRVLVAGGDGSIRTAANALSPTGIPLAVIPAGTLNHFARHIGLPLDSLGAAVVAREGIVRTVDVGRVNGRIFLNTSSVGAYETFVRRRDALERRWGYHVASLIAGWRILLRTPTIAVRIEVDGHARVYRTPLVFVGVGERDLRIPSLGERSERGKRGLHLMIVSSRTGARIAVLALQAAARGAEAVSQTPAMDSVVVDRFTIEGAQRTVSVDGELIPADSILEYEFLPDALSIIAPERRNTPRPTSRLDR